MNNQTFDTELAKQAQDEYCKKNKAPHFAPWSGECYSCHRNIYAEPNGYTVEYATSRLITGCPYCMASYCD